MGITTIEEKMMTTELSYSVPAMHCESCRLTILEEIEEVAGVEDVVIDLETKLVTVRGNVDDAAIRAAIGEAGYEAT